MLMKYMVLWVKLAGRVINKLTIDTKYTDSNIKDQ